MNASIPTIPVPSPPAGGPTAVPPGVLVVNSGSSRTRPASCGDCFFWDQPPGGATPPTRSGDPNTIAWWKDAGYCRRGKPGPGAAITSQQRTGWPATRRTDWCGGGEVR